MRINIENLAATGDAKTRRWALETLVKNMKELRDRTSAGDLAALDEFFAIYRFNDDEGQEPVKHHSAPAQPAEEDLFYLQDSRNYVGNDLLFHRKNGKGYTTNVNEAEVFTKERAIRAHESRETDIPWPKAYIDAKTRPAVDHQYVRREEALRDTGIKLIKPRRPRRSVSRCEGCGRFLSEMGIYGTCQHCGTNNAP